MERLYNDTKPIRGRAVEIRPLGKRTQVDMASISRRTDLEGKYVYAARCYHTDVVRFYPDGVVGIYHGGHPTVTTAQFIETHAPQGVYAFIQHKQMWLSINRDSSRDEGEFICMPQGYESDRMDGELKIQYLNDKWMVLNPPIVYRSMVNIPKMKEARAQVGGFIAYATTMLKLTDGWILGETKQAMRDEYRGTFATDDLIHAMSLEGKDKGYWEKAMYEVLDRCNAYAHKWNATTLNDNRYKPKQLRDAVDRLLKAEGSVMKHVEAPYGKVVRDVVRVLSGACIKRVS
jgi:hypothetical protein